jgi:hypothetical protein
MLGRLRPWHRVLARCAASRLDRELAAGASPETGPRLAARAVQLTYVACPQSASGCCRPAEVKGTWLDGTGDLT